MNVRKHPPLRYAGSFALMAAFVVPMGIQAGNPDSMGMQRASSEAGYAGLFRDAVGGVLNALVPPAQAEVVALAVGNPGTTSLNVGMGTDDPDTGLHMERSDGNAILKVEELVGSTAKRFQVQLENNGGTGFLFTDTSVANRQWQNAMSSNGDFTFSFIGTGGPELQVKPNGEVLMGPGSGVNFRLMTNGDLLIPNGAVTATAFQQSSSRAAKQDFSAVDEGEILDKLLSLEITEWEYKDPGVAGRHLGPVAEEFHALFGFGSSERHIYPADMASVSLVAARQIQREAESRDQEQNAKISTLEQQNAELKATNADLKDRLARLEQMVERISTN